MKFIFDRSLYLVTHRSGLSAEKFIEKTLEAIKGGVQIVQLREKEASFEEMCALGRILKKQLAPLKIPLIVNDRVDVALEIGAEGIHLGQSDLNASEARALMGQKAIIGLSIETTAQLLEAQHLDVDYIAASPVFSTDTKQNCSPAWGLEGLRQICRISRHPVIAIGGINESNVKSVLDCGAVGAAVISAIYTSPSPKTAAEALSRKMRKDANERMG